MYKHAQSREAKKIKFNASLHGATFEEEETTQSAKVEKKKDNGFLFQDPEEYKKMSEEERKVLTQKMMGMHKRWAANTPLNR